MTKTQELLARANHFAGRASSAKARTERNTYLSLEQSYRTLAAQYDRFETAGRGLYTMSGPPKSAATA